MKFFFAALGGLSLAASFTASFAASEQTAPPVGDWSVETVTVMAQAPGPAFWHLSKGDSEIWILGTLGPLPENLVWDTSHLAKLVEGARVVLAPPEASAGIFEVGWLLLTNSDLLSMPDGQKLEASLPPELRARFVAARESIKQDAEHYEDDAPVVAALKLERDFNKANGLSWEQPRQMVEKIASAKHVKFRTIADYDAMPMAKELLRLPADQARSCLENAVHDLELRAVHAKAAAEAWAAGDVKSVKAHYTEPNLEHCAMQSGKFSQLDERGIADSLAAIDEALSKPGKTIMLVDIGSLLRNTGVVEKLRAQGVVIEGPAQ